MRTELKQILFAKIYSTIYVTQYNQVNDGIDIKNFSHQSFYKLVLKLFTVHVSVMILGDYIIVHHPCMLYLLDQDIL